MYLLPYRLSYKMKRVYEILMVLVLGLCAGSHLNGKIGDGESRLDDIEIQIAIMLEGK